MSWIKNWLNVASVAIHSATNAILVQRGVLSPRIEKSFALPNNTTLEVALGSTGYEFCLTLPAGASCYYSFEAAATANSPVREAADGDHDFVPGGSATLYIKTTADMSAFTASLRGW